jgi:intracellular septation protein
MKILYDYFPILCFFIAFMGFGHNMILATKVTIIASAIQTIGYWLITKRFEKMHLITFVLLLIFGGATILFNNPEFIQVKPTIVYWLFAVILLVGQFRKKNYIESMLADKITAPRHVWSKLNISWATFFFALGVANYFIATHCSQEIWAYFKLFGTLGLTIIFVVLQSFFLAKFIEEPKETASNDEPKPE